MDLTALSKEELDALQLAVNIEIGLRLQRERMPRRIAAIMTEAADKGMSSAEIGGVVDAAHVVAAETAEAKRKDAERNASLAEEEKKNTPK